MTTWLALLRGVNLGKYNKVPMAELRAKLEAAGFGNVRTYIQSGNIIVDTPETKRETVAKQIHDLILEEFAVKSPAVMSTREELAFAIEKNPFLTPEVETKALRIMFLADEPTTEQISTLDPERSPGHRFAVEGRVIWLYIPQFSETKLTNDYFDRKLGTVSTLRNLSTCEALLKLLDGV